MTVNGYDSYDTCINDYISLFQGFLSEAPDLDAFLEGLSAIRSREEATPEETFLPLAALRDAFCLDEFEFFCLCLSYACELDGTIRLFFAEQCGFLLPSFGFLCDAYAGLSADPFTERFAYLQDDSSSLCLLFQIDGRLESPTPCSSLPMKLNPYILHYLSTGIFPDGAGYRLEQSDGEDLFPIHKDLFASVTSFLTDTMEHEHERYLFLYGPSGSGKTSLLRLVSSQLELPLLWVDCAFIKSLAPESLTLLSARLRAAMILEHAMLCFDGYTSDCEAALYQTAFSASSFLYPFFVISDQESLPPSSIPSAQLLEAGPLSSEEYDYMLAALISRYGYQADDEVAGCRYRLTPGQLKQALSLGWQDCFLHGQERINRNQYVKAVKQLTTQSSHTAAVGSSVTLNDVIVSQDTMDKLMLFCSFVRHQPALNRLWASEGKPFCHSGVTALFCGASGTGKTMSAHAIANELGLELMRIDLSQVFDKYIGETEKHLAAIFADASERNCILFFDEADALFSKRTDITSSHDRYANVETSFLLQSIEQYGGPVILATNLFKNFDEAFLRRIDVLVRFQMPDENLRLEIWRAAFPRSVKLAEDINLELLAKELELSPATIKTISKTSTLIALENGNSLTQKQLYYGIMIELSKVGKELLLRN